MYLEPTKSMPRLLLLSLVACLAACSPSDSSDDDSVGVDPSLETVTLRTEEEVKANTVVPKRRTPKTNQDSQAGDSLDSGPVIKVTKIADPLFSWAKAKTSDPWPAIGEQGFLRVFIPAPLATDASPKSWPPGRRMSADKMYVQREAYSFLKMYKMLEANGVQNRAFRNQRRPNLSTQQLLIQCDARQAFDYTRLLLTICANPEVAIYKISLVTSGINDIGNEPERRLIIDLPTKYNAIGEALRKLSDGQNEPTNKNVPKEWVSMTVRLRQIRTSRPGKRLVEQNTEFRVGTKKIKGASTPEILQKILRELKNTKKFRPNVVGKIDVSRGVPFGHAVAVYDLFRQAEFEAICFVGEKRAMNIVSMRKEWRRVKDDLEILMDVESKK